MQKTISSHILTERDLVSVIYQASENADNWELALEAISQYCGAKASIITLRSASSAEVVISSEIADEFHTTFISGLKISDVEIYVNKYTKKDIWAKQQARIRPILPTIMSECISFKNLEQSDFFEWINPQGINDTVVVEIASSKHFWTALNLYFWNNGKLNAKLISEKLNRVLPDIKRAWKLGRDSIQLLNIKEQIKKETEVHPNAVFLLNENNEVISYSESAQSLINNSIVEVCKKHKTLSVAINLPNSETLTEYLNINLSPHKMAQAYYVCLVIPNTECLATGEHTSLKHIHLKAKSEEQFPWNNECLDFREKRIILLIAQKKRLIDIADELDVSVRYVGTLSRTARTKLGGITKSDLHELYKNHTKSENINSVTTVYPQRSLNV